MFDDIRLSTNTKTEQPVTAGIQEPIHICVSSEVINLRNVKNIYKDYVVNGYESVLKMRIVLSYSDGNKSICIDYDRGGDECKKENLNNMKEDFEKIKNFMVEKMNLTIL